MNTERPRRPVLRSAGWFAAGALLLIAAFRGTEPAAIRADGHTDAAVDRALRLALAPPTGSTRLDDEIRAAQAKVRDGVGDVARLERLATLFVTKARATGDPGHYLQAEACADAIAAPGDADAARETVLAAELIRGHVRHALHDFAGAEAIARRLVEERGTPLDHGLLGDVLLDLGRVEAAEASYQRMLDLRPGLLSYARAAEVRWLAGDAASCRQLLVTAAAAGSRRDPESMAWLLARRASLELECGDAAAALGFADEALGFAADHPAALVARGRALLAAERNDDAVAAFTAAAERYPLPAHLWGQADALRAAGRAADAAAVELELLRTGEREDPRTFALWLATSGEEPELALRLAEAELAVRQDARSFDALAFARLRSGDVAGAEDAMQHALAVGLREARLELHAALIADAAGADVGSHLAAARAGQAALWPSERRALDRLAASR